MGRVMTGKSQHFQPAFVICVAVLALTAGGMSLARRRLGLYVEKEPATLREPLDAIDKTSLLPYKVIAEQTISNAEVLDALGTTDYIQWVLEDPSQPSDSGVRRAMLFVTYYPQPDRVPHVPEECYTGGGYQRLDTEDVRLAVGGAGVPGRYLVFGTSGVRLTAAPIQFPVIYLFRVNSEYAGNRTQARMALNRNIFNRYAYFSKVELVFNQSFSTPTKADALDAAERMLGVILPVLEAEHWPQVRSADDAGLGRTKKRKD